MSITLVKDDKGPVSVYRYVLTRLLATLIFAATALSAQAAWVRAQEPIMGTRIQVELWHRDEAAGRSALSAVMDEMHRLDRLMSSYRPDSELSEVNSNAGRRPVTVSQELLMLVSRALEFSNVSRGAFDITYASVGRMYDFRRKIRPEEETLLRALPAIDYQHVRVDDANRTIQFSHPGVRIDLGGIAKGYAADRSVQILRRRGVEHALVSAGGDTRILGDRRGRSWNVGVRDPREDGRVIAMLPLADEAISTSGDYERYFEEDGIRYHHIIQPTTGKPAGSVRSVTVIGPEATSTDALSTSLFVLGVHEGLTLVDSLPEYEAIFVDHRGDLIYSDGFERLPRSSSGQ